jgi:hypothetical protein
MGQDEIYLQVLAASGEGAERRNAKKVLNLLKKGKHWVLVSLLLGNVITNETLPIVLDRSLGGGWPAVLSSTVLIGKAGLNLSCITSANISPSHLRRDCSPVSMRALRPPHRCMVRTLSPHPHVAP